MMDDFDVAIGLPIKRIPILFGCRLWDLSSVYSEGVAN